MSPPVFEVRVSFLRQIALVTVYGFAGLFAVAFVQFLMHPGPSLIAWVQYYLPYFPILLGLFCVVHAIRRQPRAWLHGDRFFSRGAPLQAIRSVPLRAVDPMRLLKPTLWEYCFSGVRFAGPNGDRVMVPVSFYSRSQLQALAQAISRQLEVLASTTSHAGAA